MRRGEAQELSQGWAEQLQLHPKPALSPHTTTQGQAGVQQNEAIHLKRYNTHLNGCSWEF